MTDCKKLWVLPESTAKLNQEDDMFFKIWCWLEKKNYKAPRSFYNKRRYIGNSDSITSASTLSSPSPSLQTTQESPPATTKVNRLQYQPSPQVGDKPTLPSSSTLPPHHETPTDHDKGNCEIMHDCAEEKNKKGKKLNRRIILSPEGEHYICSPCKTSTKSLSQTSTPTPSSPSLSSPNLSTPPRTATESLSQTSSPPPPSSSPSSPNPSTPPRTSSTESLSQTLSTPTPSSSIISKSINPSNNRPGTIIIPIPGNTFEDNH